MGSGWSPSTPVYDQGFKQRLPVGIGAGFSAQFPRFAAAFVGDSVTRNESGREHRCTKPGQGDAELSAVDAGHVAADAVDQGHAVARAEGDR